MIDSGGGAEAHAIDRDRTAAGAKTKQVEMQRDFGPGWNRA